MIRSAPQGEHPIQIKSKIEKPKYFLIQTKVIEFEVS